MGSFYWESAQTETQRITDTPAVKSGKTICDEKSVNGACGVRVPVKKRDQ